mmetsp:Transcript_15856/g.31051  ORF Transcript_15856/g.31051 Transcript_15856/m.31051 type:complete len:655 (+) Transcript_15856:34-1998(+)|eukprot:CAMPEP_0175139100 /NCGR_PEP_ID=MMETSP0087-20121206/10709_1 /TAXON_ID=136419 /ORGANISM="Unknown Unknown, Strain D1" /LENGTH=654 /DNA_ID=CAMNT_0016422061 /DNA_START=34 /DNA_END=1998 /DNA_ORIENTATION=+
MAEVEVDAGEIQVEVEVEVEVEAEATVEEGETADKPKKKRDETPLKLEDIKVVAQPNEAEYISAKREAQNNLDLVLNKIADVAAKIEVATKKRQACMDKKKAIQDGQADLKAKREAASSVAEGAQEQIEAIEKSRAERRRALDVHKKGLKFTKVEDLDLAVQKIQLKLTTAGLPRELQQKLLTDLNTLKSQRQKVLTYTALRQLAEAEKVDIATPMAALENEKKVNADNAKKQQKYSEEYNKAREEEKVIRKEVDALFNEKRALGKDKYKFANVVNDIERGYQRKLREYTRYVEQVKYVKRVAARAARAARQKEWEENNADHNEKMEQAEAKEPYFKELQICSDLITYLSAFLPKSSTPRADDVPEQEQTHQKVAQDRNSAFKGKVAKSKEQEKDEAEEWAQAARDTFGQKKKRVRAKKVKVSLINHIPDVFPKFKTIGIQAPNTTAQVEERLEAVRQKLEYFKTAPPPPKKGKQSDAAAEDPEEIKERAANQSKSLEAQDDEQQRRVAEAEQANVEQSKQRRKSVTMASNLADAEQQRRIAEAEAEVQRDAEERKENVRRASLMADEEQARRIREDQGKGPSPLQKAVGGKGGATSGDLNSQLQAAEFSRTGKGGQSQGKAKGEGKAKGGKGAQSSGDVLTDQLQAAEKARSK